MHKALDKKTYRRGIVPLFFALTAALLLGALQSCDALNDYGIDKKSKFTPNGALPENREPISIEDIPGTYQGDIHLFMDGKRYGPYTETIHLKKDAYQRYNLDSPKMSYGNTMPAEISYSFSNITLTPAADGTSIAFTGTNGNTAYHNQGSEHNDQGINMGKHTTISGSLYKINSKIYITYTTVYDTAEMKKFIKLKLKGHNDMSGTAAGSPKK